MRAASVRAVAIGLAASSAMIRASSSLRSATTRTAASSTSARSWGASGSANRSLAIATARSTCSGVHTGTRPMTCPS